MRVPMTIADFLDRAELGFADTTAVVDEPDQPVAACMEQAPERRGVRSIVQARSKMKACQIDTARRELLERLQASHEVEIERELHLCWQRVAQRRQRQIVTGRYGKLRYGQRRPARGPTCELDREPCEDPDEPPLRCALPGK